MYNEKKKITNERYLAKMKTVTLRMKPEEHEAIKAAANGKSVQGYILQAVRERMEREGTNGSV